MNNLIASKYSSSQFCTQLKEHHKNVNIISSNDYFHAYAIIYFLANQLVFQNMVTYSYRIFVLSKLLLIHLRLTEVLHKVTACLIKFCLNRTKASFAWQLAIVQMTSCMCYLHVNNFISRDFSSCQLLSCTCSASRVK